MVAVIEMVAPETVAETGDDAWFQGNRICNFTASGVIVLRHSHGTVMDQRRVKNISHGRDYSLGSS